MVTLTSVSKRGRSNFLLNMEKISGNIIRLFSCYFIIFPDFILIDGLMETRR